MEQGLREAGGEVIFMVSKARIEQLRKAREFRLRELQVLADARQSCDPIDAISWAGYWLERWRGRRSVLRGKPRGSRCSTISPTGTIPQTELTPSGFLLST